ncbi:hypothetical protein Tco_0024539 [Tanacetum coccineum]
MHKDRRSQRRVNPYGILPLKTTDEHLGSTWRKYMHFRLNLGRNGTRLQLYSKLLKVLVPDREDSVNIPRESIYTRPPNGLHAKINQELNELLEISAMIDSHLENIDCTQIKIPSPVPIEQLFDNFMDSPGMLEMDDLESDNESINTPLVSLFFDSDDESDDGEVLNELDEYGNAAIFFTIIG